MKEYVKDEMYYTWKIHANKPDFPIFRVSIYKNGSISYKYVRNTGVAELFYIYTDQTQKSFSQAKSLPAYNTPLYKALNGSVE